MDKHTIRTKVVDEFSSLVIGPRNGEDEFIEGKRGVTLRYMTGILFPQGQDRSGLAKDSDEFSEEESEVIQQNDDFGGDQDNPLSMANEELPSSVGISFVLKANTPFEVEVEAAKYVSETMLLNGSADNSNNKVKAEGLKGFRRKTYKKEIIEISCETNHYVFNRAAKLNILKRKSNFHDGSEIFTVSLINNQKVETTYKNSEDNIEKRLYQVKLKVTTPTAKIQPYENLNSISSDIEEQILALQYCSSPVYAVGHGASVKWDSSNESVDSVEISYIPSSITPRPLFDKLTLSSGVDFKSKNIFNIHKLANSSNKNDLLNGFTDLVTFYKDWIQEQSTMADGTFEEAENTLIAEMEICRERIEEGIQLLKKDPECWHAFQLANQAMLFQIDQGERLKSLRKKRAAEGLSWPVKWDETTETFNLQTSYNEENSRYWRPFQLAFFLMSVTGLENPTSTYRNNVDLIWFSTGGGKTEAYLLLASYELIRRRMRHESPEVGYGTGVITRYTLRFLTSDQFSRTTSLGCALEKVRSVNKELLGEEPFSVGLYVGQAASYNKLSDAKTDWNAINSSPDVSHKFQLIECPNCGTELIPRERKYDENGNLLGFGIEITSCSIKYKCNNNKCMFSECGIPIKTTDEEIYNSPPSFLLGTLDKFALLTWTQEAGKIFGSHSKRNVCPPSLIIQDELHLISGPLGTISAVFEAGFDELIKVNQEKLGLPATGPKYIASSATVRDSSTQIQRLLARPSAIFPPRGLRFNDSFFAKSDNSESKGRLYIGLMAQGLRSTSAAHWASGALVQSVRYISSLLQNREEIDFLWTTLCYCNSKRELGLINASVNQEILERMRVSAAAQGIDPNDVISLKKEEVSSDGVKSISETRANLLHAVQNENPSEVRDFVPCTNMISVGVDIDRLGMMIVNGQPKTTSEYIQATSRVGRNPDGNGPGLVLTLYSPAKPRDRSHYEHFQAYHETLYRLVEPTSVTPGSDPALSRTLHSAVVTLVRHGYEAMSSNTSATSFDISNSEINNLLIRLENRLLTAYPDEQKHSYERATIKNFIQRTIGLWSEWAKSGKLYYSASDKNINSLLVRHGDYKGPRNIGFYTMQSMRGVDAEVEVRI